MKEQQMQKAILNYLAIKKYFAFKINNGGVYKQATGKYIPAQTKGICDIIAIKDKNVYFIECKTEVGKLSPAQKNFRDNIEKQWGLYYIIRSVDDLMRYGF